jgi:hypothetical protein
MCLAVSSGTFCFFHGLGKRLISKGLALKKPVNMLDMMVHAYNPSTQEAEVEGL